MEQLNNKYSGLIDEICDYFSSLPDERTREYEKLISKMASSCTSPEKQKALEEIMESDSPYAFEAFYCLCTLYRRNRDYELMRQLIKTHTRFSDRISFNHIIIQYQVHSESMFDYDELLESAYEDANKLEDNAGFLQSFCNAFATICENCNVEDLQSIIKRWYPDALRLINKAIKLDPHYAKFYCTKARIVALKGNFEEANKLITQAISYEDSHRPDYFLTILNYQYTRSRIAMMHENTELTYKIDILEKKLSELCSRIDTISDMHNAGPDITSEIVAPPVYEGDKPYAFISYAHKDKESVYAIIHELQKNGIRIWYDNGIRAGEEWPEEIGLHLNKSDLVLIMLSSNAINSKFVRREINAADSNNKKILAVVLDDCKITIGIQLQLGLNQMRLKSNYTHQKFISTLTDDIHQIMEEC